MSHIPDCRTDEAYNEKYLNNTDKEYVNGFDYAVEQVLNLIDNNLDVYPDLETILDRNKAIVNVDKVQIAHDAIEDWLEGERDMLITSMIDNMDEDEYNKIKKEVDNNV